MKTNGIRVLFNNEQVRNGRQSQGSSSAPASIWSKNDTGTQRRLPVRWITSEIDGRKPPETRLCHSNPELWKASADVVRSEEALRQALQELQKSHEELKAAQMQLIHAGRMECIGTLAAGVAHEVKNPLQTILMGLAYLAKNLQAADKNVPLVIADMRDAVHRADGIVQDLMQFSAANQLQMRDENLSSIVTRSLKLVNYELTRARITVVRHLAEALPPLRLDSSKMAQVFINLYLNAAHAMPQGGTLIVTTRTERAESSQPVVVAEIQDTGTGIPEACLSRIFEPFFTTKPASIGTGLGLTVTRRIVELHNGTIDIRNRSKGGVTVTLTFKPQR